VIFAGARLDARLRERLRAWQALPEPRLSSPAAETRWVVVDVESSGLDPTRAALLAVGAIAVEKGGVRLDRGFEAVLRQERPSEPSNIEIHGIGGTEQLAGGEAAPSLVAFLEFIGKDPLVAYHAPFDETLLRRALRERLGLRFRRAWLDLAVVAPLAWPGRAKGPGLDGWLDAFSIPVAQRHRAIVDCLATAQLLVALFGRAAALGARDAAGLLRLSSQGHWLDPRPRD
jgi:DNA polymerase-3 subunit epsilon